MGEASNPGPNRRRPTRRPVEGRDVHRRISTQLDSDSDAALVPTIPDEELLDDLERDLGTVVSSRDAPFAHSGRFHVMSSDADEEPLVPTTGGSFRTSSTVPASSRALRRLSRNVAPSGEVGPTQWESGAAFSLASRPSEFNSQFEVEAGLIDSSAQVPSSLIGALEYDLTVRDSDINGSPEQARDNEARRDDGEHEVSDTESDGAFHRPRRLRLT